MLYGILIKGEAVRNIEVDIDFNEGTADNYYDDSQWEEYVEADVFVGAVEVQDMQELKQTMKELAVSHQLSEYSLKAIRLYEAE